MNKQLDISGIYCIHNKINNYVYIGSAVNIRIRFNSHKSELEKNKHHSQYLQNSFNKHGGDNFNLYVLAKCPPEYLIKLEQWFLDNVKPEYNIAKTAGSTLGIKQSQETIEKNRAAQLGRKWTKEALNKRTETVRKDVHQYTLDGYYIQTFHGVRLAGDSLNVPYQQIVSCCTDKKAKQAGNFQWSYIKLDKLSKVDARKRYKKQISQYTKEGELIKVWESATLAAKELDLNKGNLCHYAKLKNNFLVGGYKWRYD